MKDIHCLVSLLDPAQTIQRPTFQAKAAQECYHVMATYTIISAPTLEPHL